MLIWDVNTAGSPPGPPPHAVLPLLTGGREVGPWRCSWHACPDSQRTQQAADHCERGARLLGMPSGLRLLAALSRSPPVLLCPDGAQCHGQHGIARGWDAAPSPREPSWAACSWRDTFPPLHQDTHACAHLRHDVRPASFCPVCLPHGSVPRSGKSRANWPQPAGDQEDTGRGCCHQSH